MKARRTDEPAEMRTEEKSLRGERGKEKQHEKVIGTWGETGKEMLYFPCYTSKKKIREDSEKNSQTID